MTQSSQSSSSSSSQSSSSYDARYKRLFAQATIHIGGSMAEPRQLPTTEGSYSFWRGPYEWEIKEPLPDRQHYPWMPVEVCTNYPKAPARAEWYVDSDAAKAVAQALKDKYCRPSASVAVIGASYSRGSDALAPSTRSTTAPLSTTVPTAPPTHSSGAAGSDTPLAVPVAPLGKSKTAGVPAARKEERRPIEVSEVTEPPMPSDVRLPDAGRYFMHWIVLRQVRRRRSARYCRRFPWNRSVNLLPPLPKWKDVYFDQHVTLDDMVHPWAAIAD